MRIDIIIFKNCVYIHRDDMHHTQERATREKRWSGPSKLLYSGVALRAVQQSEVKSFFFFTFILM